MCNRFIRVLLVVTTARCIQLEQRLSKIQENKRCTVHKLRLTTDPLYSRGECYNTLDI